VPDMSLTGPSEWAAKPTPRQECLLGINSTQVRVLRPDTSDADADACRVLCLGAAVEGSGTQGLQCSEVRKSRIGG